MLTSSPSLVEPEDTDSAALLATAQAGDPEAFCVLCRIYETPLLRHATTVCANLVLAEDLTQETLVEAWKCLHRYNGRCRFFTWLCAILLNRYRNTVRQKRPSTISAFGVSDGSEPENPVEQLADDAVWPDQAAQVRERAGIIRKCIQALPRKHQQVVYLRFYVEDSLEGIATALGCSVGTVKSRLFHALEKLRTMKDLSAQSARVEDEIR